MQYNFCVIFDKKFLIKGLTLYNSLLENCESEFRFFALCLDEESFELLQKMDKKNIVPIQLTTLENNELRMAKKDRTMAEYSWTLKPYLLEYVFDHYPDAEVLMYLDSDLFFYSSPKTIVEELGENGVLLTPHNLPKEKKNVEDGYGIYNAGFLAFRNNENGRKCLSWWRQMCLEWCFDKVETNRQGDQKYLDYFEDKFNGVISSENKGLNVAMWNMKNYAGIIKKVGKKVLIGKETLVFFHFAKFQLYYPKSLILPNLPHSYYSFPDTAKKIIYDRYVKSVYMAVTEVQKISPNFEHGLKLRPDLMTLIKKDLLPQTKTYIFTKASVKKTLRFSLLINKIKSIVSYFFDNLQVKPESINEGLAVKLREAINDLPRIDLTKKYGADLAWNRMLIEFRRNILHGNLANFTNWQVVRNGMFYKARSGEIDFLKKRKDWPVIEKALKESPIGNPPKYPGVEQSSGNLIHHAYNLAQYFENIEDIKKISSILEMGGGYGSLARLVYSLGFRGTYHILDFPELGALQKYYLESLGIETNKYFEFVSNIDAITMKEPELLIGWWSLSETSLQFRNKFLSKVNPKNYFIAYQYKFEEVDNIEYFKKLRESIKNVDWREYDVPDFSTGTSKYLIGHSR